MAALRPAIRDHRLRRPDHLIEIIQDRRTFDQDLAILEHQRRHPPQRIERRDLVGIAEGRPWPVLEGKAVKLERNRHAPGERGIILADQDHWIRVTLIGLDGYDLRLPEIGQDHTETLPSFRGANKASPERRVIEGPHDGSDRPDHARTYCSHRHRDPPLCAANAAGRGGYVRLWPAGGAADVQTGNAAAPRLVQGTRRVCQPVVARSACGWRGGGLRRQSRSRGRLRRSTIGGACYDFRAGYHLAGQDRTYPQ